MSDKRFIVGETLRDYYQIKCEKKDYSRVLAPNTVARLLNKQQATIDKLEQRDYYNQSERYKILCRAIELTANYIHNSNEEYYDFCALITEFEKELLDDE